VPKTNDIDLLITEAVEIDGQWYDVEARFSRNSMKESLKYYATHMDVDPAFRPRVVTLHRREKPSWIGNE
jgi:hypothetical protein